MGDFGDAIDANRSADGSDPDVGVEDHVFDLVEAARVVSCQWRQPRGAESGNPYLPTVGVAGELQVEAPRGRAGIGEIRLVSAT